MKSNAIPHTILLTTLYLLLLFPFIASAEYSGSWYGSVTITTPAEMAPIDLAFHLEVIGTTTQLDNDNSYIILEKTMIFPAVGPKIDGRDVGPRLTGTFSPDTFSLVSNPFTSNVGGKEVTRHIELTQTEREDDGQTLTGIYTETVTGLLPNALTISGEFILLKPMPLTAPGLDDNNGNGCLDLDEIRAGGYLSDQIEFSDASEAMNILHGTGAIPLCPPANQTARDTLQEYYNEQN